MKFSVITVCYNSVNTIERTIQSVIKQNHKNVEYIIIDGGSTDGTLDIIKKYESYIAYWESKADNGIYDAMNKGIKYVTGNIISFLNSDDWYEEDIFPVIEKYFKEFEVDIVSGSIHVMRDGKEAWKYRQERDISQIYFKSVYAHPATFTKRKVFEKYGLFDLNYRIAADYEWFLRLYKNRVKILQVIDIFANFSLGGLSSIFDIRLPIEEYYIRIKHLSVHNRKEVMLKIEELLRKSLYEYIKYNGLQIIEQNVTFIKEMWPIIKKVKKVNIFGAGNEAEKTISILNKLGITVDLIFDNNRNKWNGEIGGIKICKPFNLDSEFIIISSIKYEKEMKEQLEGEGLIWGEQFLSYAEIENKIIENLIIEVKRGNVCPEKKFV